jgi:hypothetical protein
VGHEVTKQARAFQAERLNQARRDLAAFKGSARLDGFQNGRAWVLMWEGITEPGGGVILTTEDWGQYYATMMEFLGFDAIKPKERQTRALQPARKPAGRADALQGRPKKGLPIRSGRA